MEVIVLGVQIGFASGWDEIDGLGLVFYDFVAFEPDFEWANSKDLHVSFDDGVFAYYDDNGKVVESRDIKWSI
jgi:hypothetical protein